MADKKFLDSLTKGFVDALAAAHQDGGADGDDARQRRYDHIKPLYGPIAPPPLNEFGALVNPDAGPDDALEKHRDKSAKAKAKAKPAAKKAAKKSGKKK